MKKNKEQVKKYGVLYYQLKPPVWAVYKYRRVCYANIYIIGG